MADTRRMVFDFIANDRVSKTMKNIGDNSSKLAGKFSAIGKTAALGVAGAAVGGVALLSKFMIQGVKDAVSYQTLLNKTAAVIKSTGGAANVSVKHVKELAGSLESLSGVDEELIINSQNVLMTFTAIKNTKTQDTFDQATKAALNMSTALGTDLKNSTILVGKALNDPIKGVTALRRVGVNFNKTQLDTIKKLETSGHHEKAQALILKELNKEFGGAAKAAGKGFAGSMARAQDAVSDAFRAVGMKLLPVLTKLADWFASKGWPQMVKFATTMKTKLEPAFRTVSAWVSAHFMPAVRALAQWVSTKLMPALRKLAGVELAKVREVISKVSSAIRDNKAHYQGLFTVIGKVAKFIGKNLLPVAIFFAKVLLTVLGKALSAIIRILGTVIGWIGKLYRGAVTAGKFVAAAAKAMGRAWDAFKTKIKVGTLTILSIFATMVSKLISGAARAFGWVPGIGPKLRRAAAAVKKWKDDVNAELNRIKGPKQVNFSVTAHGSIFGPGNKKLGAAARGGPIESQGPGSSQLKDSVLYALRVNEHVWTPEEVTAVGGHKKMLALRKMARKGLLRTAAGGGPVGWAPTNKLQSMASFRSKVTKPINAGMATMSLMLAKALAAIWKKYASAGGVVAAARRMIGYPYSWGGGGKSGPSRGIGRGAGTYGFDCSGLTQYAWWQGRHIDIGGTTGPQHANSHPTTRRPGALGFPHLGHVMIASDKPGFVIQAPYTGSYVQEVRRSASDWRWPNRAAAGGPVVALGSRAIAGWAPKSAIAQAKLAMIAGDPSKIARRGSGGPVKAGLSYLTGEYGPEVFTPKRSGTIHPAGSSVVHVDVHVAGHALATKREIADEVLSALRTAKKNGVRVDV
jgi:hypothetical protein